MTFARSKNKVKLTAALRGGTSNRGQVMKVTRLKRGYRINLSDAEMTVLTRVFGEGAGSGMVEDLTTRIFGIGHLQKKQSLEGS